MSEYVCSHDLSGYFVRLRELEAAGRHLAKLSLALIGPADPYSCFSEDEVDAMRVFGYLDKEEI